VTEEEESSSATGFVLGKMIMYIQYIELNVRFSAIIAIENKNIDTINV